RGRDTGKRSQEDIRSVASAQAELKKRAETAAAQIRRAGADPARPRIGRGGAAPDDPMNKAVEAMGRAQRQLEALRTDGALPNEMTALNELMRAQADVRRREVQRQQAG